MPADPKVDIWAIGVIAWELILKQPALPLGMSDDQKLAAIARTGDAPTALPWEGADRASRKKLGPLRVYVEACLNRNPEQRPTAEKLAKALNHQFMSSTGGASLVRPVKIAAKWRRRATPCATCCAGSHKCNHCMCADSLYRSALYG